MEKNLKFYLRFFRTRDWSGYFLMAVFGFFISKGFSFPAKDISIFFALVFSFLAFGFAINNCFDTKEDKYIKDRINPVVSKEISFKNSLILSAAPGILGLILSAVFGLRVFLFFLIGVAVVYFYSAPPLRFKERPVLDLASHGFFFGVFLFLLPLLIFKAELNQFHYLISFSIFYFSIMLELRNHLEDYESDKKANLRTSVCVFGRNFSEKFLRYLAFLFPLTLSPIFLLIFPKYLFLFLIFTSIFLFSFQFFQNFKIVKNYRIMDIYAVFSFAFLTILIIF